MNEPTTMTPTDTEQETKYGPSWRLVAAVLARAEVLTPEEADTLAAAWSRSPVTAWSTVRDAAWSVVWGVSWDAAWDDAWDAARGAARGAVADAAGAAAAFHLIGTRGFTQAHYDTLTGPWVSVCGPIVAEVTS